MEKKTKTYILISILVALLIVLLLVYLLLAPKPQEVVDAPVPVAPIEQADLVIPVSNVVTAVTSTEIPRNVTAGTADQGLVAKQTARIFVERFLTYSSQNDNRHLASVAEMMTPVMANWANKQVQEQSLLEYAGVTSLVVTSELSEFDGTSAMVTVSLQQIFETNGQKNTEQRSGEVELIFEQGTWLVEGFYWDK
jgi:hypothetical protein